MLDSATRSEMALSSVSWVERSHVRYKRIREIWSACVAIKRHGIPSTTHEE